MRLRTPAAVSTWDIIVRKPTSEHVSVRSASGDDLNGVSTRFAALVSQALAEAFRGLLQADPTAWAVVQLTGTLGDWLAVERMERLDIRCADKDGGRATADGLCLALESLGVRVCKPVAGLGENLTRPDLVLYGGVVFGTGEVANVDAEFLPDGDADSPALLEGANRPPVVCPACRVRGRPTRLFWGYPMPWLQSLLNLLERETEDRSRLMGCIIPESGLAFWACPACEAPYHPGWLTAEEFAAAALRGGTPVPRCPRLFEDGDRVLWSPQAETDGESQRYAIAPGMAARLDEASSAWVGFRPKTGATLLVDWATIRGAAPGPIERPLAFSTRLGRQVVRVKGHILPAKLLV